MCSGWAGPSEAKRQGDCFPRGSDMCEGPEVENTRRARAVLLALHGAPGAVMDRQVLGRGCTPS